MNRNWSSDSIKKMAEQEARLFIERHSSDLPSIMKELEDLYDKYTNEGKEKNPNHQLMYSISVKYYILRDFLEHSNDGLRSSSRRLEKLRLSPQPDKDSIKKCCDKEADQINNEDDVFNSGVFSRHGFYGGVYDNSANKGESVKEQPSIPQPSIRNQTVVMKKTNYSTADNNQNKRHSLPNPTLPRHSFYGMFNSYADTTSRPRIYDPPTVTYPDPPVLPKFDYYITFSCCQDILSQLDFSKIPDYPSISFGATDKKSVDIGDIE